MLNYQRVPSWLILAKCIVQVLDKNLYRCLCWYQFSGLVSEARASWPLMKALGRGSGRVMQKQQRFQTLGPFAPFFCGLGVDGHRLTWIENILQIVADYEIMAGENVRIFAIWSIRKRCSATVLIDAAWQWN